MQIYTKDMKAKKVKVEVIGAKKKKKGFELILHWIKKIFFSIKLVIAIVLDLADFFLGIIPIINAVWDVICFFILLIMLKNKKLAFIVFVELPLILPPLSFINMLLPINTLVVILDNAENKER